MLYKHQILRNCHSITTRYKPIKRFRISADLEIRMLINLDILITSMKSYLQILKSKAHGMLKVILEFEEGYSIELQNSHDECET